jgi:hypothetical protein
MFNPARRVSLVILGSLWLLAPAPVPARSFVPTDPESNLGDRTAKTQVDAVTTLTRDLNARLAQLRDAAGPEAALDARLVRRLNVTRPGNNMDPALLLRDGRVEWPKSLRDPAYADGRKQVDALLSELAKRARGDGVTVQQARDFADAIKVLNDLLLKQIADISPGEYVESKRYLNRLDAVRQILRAPDLRAVLDAADRLHAKVRTMGGLLKFLDSERLELTNPLPGDEDAYRQLDRALRAYAKKPAEAARGK